MSSPILQLANTQLSTGAALLYASPTGVWTEIAKVLLVNTDTSPHAVTLYVVPSGAAAATANMSTDAQAVLAKQSWPSPNEPGLVLNPGDALWGLADTGAVVNCLVSGILTTS